MMGWRRAARGLVVLAGLAVAGCATSAGHPAAGFLTSEIANAYLPLEGAAYLVMEGHGAGVVIAPGIAVTNAHNANLLDPASILGSSTDYDLLFFRTARRQAPPRAAPQVGEAVIAYGQGVDGELRMARGPVRWTDAPVLPRCPGCEMQQAFAFEADGGKGFSGGPVIDAASGRLVGIVFGFRNGIDGRSPGHRLMYAYDMQRVLRELSAVRRAAAAKRP